MKENCSGIQKNHGESRRIEVALKIEVASRRIVAASRIMESKKIEVVPWRIVLASRRLHRENCSDIQENWSIKSLVSTSRAVRRNIEISSSTTAMVSKKERSGINENRNGIKENSSSIEEN